jgi:hypothetical protein
MDDDFENVDDEILDEIAQKRQKKSFNQVINKSKFSKYDLDEVMVEG